MIDKEATGGQAGTSSRIENYLGFPKGLSGADLARRATAQAQRLGAEILTAREVTGVRVEDPYRYVTLGDGTELACRALVLATGVTVRRLDVPGVEALTGAGIYYGAALTEAAHYRGEHVFVVGGANSAGQGAMFFSQYASKVTMLVRGSFVGQEHVSVPHRPDRGHRQYRSSAPVRGGGSHWQGPARGHQDSEQGHRQDRNRPRSRHVPLYRRRALTASWWRVLVECNKAGFILTGPDLSPDGHRPKNWKLRRDPYLLETSVPGIFAAGDIQAGRGSASSFGRGAGRDRHQPGSPIPENRLAPFAPGMPDRGPTGLRECFLLLRLFFVPATSR